MFRREVGHVLDSVDAPQLAVFGRKRGHRHRHVLQVGLPLFGGDDDFADGRRLAGVGRIGRSIRRGGGRVGPTS